MYAKDIWFGKAIKMQSNEHKEPLKRKIMQNTRSNSAAKLQLVPN